MSDEKDTMQCELCGAYSARIRRVHRTLGKGEELILVERIPLVVCRNCGESYFTAATLRHLEQIRETRESRTTPRTIPVAAFDEQERPAPRT
jgi:YgiT-type zinc finger domain-containing protein